MPTLPRPKVLANPLTRRLVFIGGWVSFVLGVIGAFLPIMPTVPFMLLAAACFARSSPRFYIWITRHPTFGPPVANYLAGKGLPLKAKIIALVMLWFGISSGLLLVNWLWLQLLIFATAVGVSVYLLRLPLAASNPSRS